MLMFGDTSEMEMGSKVMDMLLRSSEDVSSTALCRYHLPACHIHGVGT